MVTKKSLKQLGLLFAVALLAAALPLQVKAEGAKTWTVCSVGCDFTTIQGAIDAAGAGDTVEVAAGTYHETLNLTKGSLTIKGAGAGSTTIDADESGTVLTVSSSVTSPLIVEGFTITGGKVNFENGGGIFNQSNSLTIKNCVITGNQAFLGNGGGMYNEGVSPTIIGTVFSNNSAAYGGGIYNSNSSPSVTGSQFVGNSADSGSVMYTVGSPSAPNITLSQISPNNPAAEDGVLVFADYGVSHNASPNWWGQTTGPAAGKVSGSVKVNPWCYNEGCTELFVAAGGSIQDAIDAAPGGGVVHVAAGTYHELLTIDKALTLQGADQATTFIDGDGAGTVVTISADGVAVSGFTIQNGVGDIAGGISIEGSETTEISATITDCTIKNNSGISAGGLMSYYASLDVSDCTFDYNNISESEEGGYGGALAHFYGSSLKVSRSTFSNNIGWDGGGILIAGEEGESVSATISQSTFTNNKADPGDGGAINIVNNASASISNSTFSGNTAEHGGAIWNSGSSDVVVHYSKFTGNTAIYEGDEIYTNKAIDASPNWWGSVAGPAATAIVGNVDYDPWCGDEACSFLNPNYLPSGVTAAEIQAAINNAHAGEIIVIPAGTYNQSGGFTIGKPGVTIRLTSGAIIQNSSPCFIVNADNVTITSETIGGGKCVPTGGSDGILVNAGVKGLRIVGLNIDGSNQTTGDGIHFNGAITNFQIVNNYIHDLDGSAIEFVSTPSGTTMDIQGNLFKTVGTPAIAVPTGANLDATYNSWGTLSAPTIPDVTTAPNTHVKVFVESSGTPWANQVVAGRTITYTVKADLTYITGAEITLLYPSGISISGSVTKGGTFNTENVSTAEPGKIVFYGFQTPQGEQPIVPVSGEGKVLFTVTFTVPSAGSYPLSFDLATDNFAMAPAKGPSNYVYAESLTGATIKGITLPEISSADIDGPYLAGVAQDFQVTTTNPAAGGNFAHVLFNYRISGAVLADIYRFQYKAGDQWLDMPLTQVGPDLVGYFGPQSGFPMGAPYSATTTFRITFKTVKNYPFTLTLNDLDASNEELAKLEATATVNGNFAITGTFSMQGRFTRGGIPVTLTWTGTEWQYSASDTTEDLMDNNFQVTVTYGGGYRITTNQPRYLDVTATLGKTINISTNDSIAPLELRAGDANDDNEIEVGDAGIVGGEYWQTGSDKRGDVNFDLIVNIQDLALVGSNYTVTSATAYGSWTP